MQVGRSRAEAFRLALVLVLACALSPLALTTGAFAAEVNSPTTDSAESSLAVLTPERPEATDPPVEPRLVVATEVLTSGKLSAMTLAAVARTAYLVQKAKTRNGARYVGKLLAEENYGWSGAQWKCLDKLWINESQWTYTSHNKRTGAHGIPQAYPATKYESMGSDWRKNPVTQILWGLRYIEVRYKTPCRALSTFYRTKMY